MTARQLMSHKGTTPLRDKYSGARFTVSEITIILIQMVTARDPEADEFADRFEVCND